MDIDAVDLIRLDDRRVPRDRGVNDVSKQPFAFGRDQHLGIRDAGHVVIGPEDDGGGDDGTGEAPAAHFVNAGHMYVAEPADLVLDGP